MGLICRSSREGYKIYLIWVMHIKTNFQFFAHFAPRDFFWNIWGLSLTPGRHVWGHMDNGGIDPSAKGVGSVLGIPPNTGGGTGL